MDDRDIVMRSVAVVGDFSLIQNTQICPNLAYNGFFFPGGDLPTHLNLVPTLCHLVAVLE